MLQMGLLEGNVYNLTVAAMMHSVLTFSLINGIKEKHKLDLLCCPARMSLLLYNLEPYGVEPEKPDKVPIIPKMKVKSTITISTSRLVPGVWAANSFCAALVDPPISRFTTSPGLSDVDHVRRHACVVVEIEKKTGFSLGPYQLDTLFPPVLVPGVVDKMAYC